MQNENENEIETGQDSLTPQATALAQGGAV